MDLEGRNARRERLGAMDDLRDARDDLREAEAHLLTLDVGSSDRVLMVEMIERLRDTADRLSDAAAGGPE